ncbi:hypothetical protein [Sphingomonas sp. Root241]|uniref:hypothetical protein n=1 Tax=Sphingomonas sp. Root241 TaxID=1736501 RepID=UPI00138F2A95|nr:hypothetical protein [Sphingomonas sp. Root241]
MNTAEVIVAPSSRKLRIASHLAAPEALPGWVVRAVALDATTPSRTAIAHLAVRGKVQVNRMVLILSSCAEVVSLSELTPDHVAFIASVYPIQADLMAATIARVDLAPVAMQ